METVSRLIIAGGRDFTDYNMLCKAIETYGLVNVKEIVSGGARGADRLGEQYAKEYNIPLTVINAKWDEYGKSAGIKRNREMAEYAVKDSGGLLAFWDGESGGTKNMIDTAQQFNLKLFLVMYNGIFLKPDTVKGCEKRFNAGRNISVKLTNGETVIKFNDSEYHLNEFMALCNPNSAELKLIEESIK